MEAAANADLPLQGVIHIHGGGIRAPHLRRTAGCGLWAVRQGRGAGRPAAEETQQRAQVYKTPERTASKAKRATRRVWSS